MSDFIKVGERSKCFFLLPLCQVYTRQREMDRPSHKVLGVDIPSTPLEVRHELWEEVTRERALLSSVDSIVSEVTLDDIPRVTRAMLDEHLLSNL
jgi:hypothetical protein